MKIAGGAFGGDMIWKLDSQILIAIVSSMLTGSHILAVHWSTKKSGEKKIGKIYLFAIKMQCKILAY